MGGPLCFVSNLVLSLSDFIGYHALEERGGLVTDVSLGSAISWGCHWGLLLAALRHCRRKEMLVLREWSLEQAKKWKNNVTILFITTACWEQNSKLNENQIKIDRQTIQKLKQIKDYRDNNKSTPNTKYLQLIISSGCRDCVRGGRLVPPSHSAAVITGSQLTKVGGKRSSWNSSVWKKSCNEWEISWCKQKQ